MKQRLLFILISCALYTFGTEITKSGSCPSPPQLKPVANFSLDQLDGRYAVLAFYKQVPSLGLDDTCYRMTFTPINNNRTLVETRSKPAVYIGLPNTNKYYLEQTSDNGTFNMLDFLFETYRGAAYVLFDNGNITVLTTCRYSDILKTFSQDVMVISQNTEYTAESQADVKKSCRDNGLNFGIVRSVEQGREECTPILALD